MLRVLELNTFTICCCRPQNKKGGQHLVACFVLFIRQENSREKEFYGFIHATVLFLQRPKKDKLTVDVTNR